jgi:hypothetical protein
MESSGMKDSYKFIAFIILTQLVPEVGYAQLGWIWPSKRESPSATSGPIDWAQLPKSQAQLSNETSDSSEADVRPSDQTVAGPPQDFVVATNLPGAAMDPGDSVVQHVFSDANAAPVVAASGSRPDSQVKHIPWGHLFEENEAVQPVAAGAAENEVSEKLAEPSLGASMIGPVDEIFASNSPHNLSRSPQLLSSDAQQLGLITIRPEQPRSEQRGQEQMVVTAPPAMSPSEPSLITDEFPEYVLQNLQVAQATQADEETVIPIDIMPFKRLASGEEMSVDGFYSVESMIGPMAGADVIFSNLHIQDDFRDRAGAPLEEVRSDKDDAGFGPEWPYQNYAWVSPTFSHAPLYFEQVNLERYGIGSNRYLQPVCSFVHFFGSVGLLPYKVLTQHPRERVYTLGHQRPGDRVAYQKRSLLGQSYPGEACKYFHDYSGYR